MNKNERSWYMKNEMFYFVVSTSKSKYTFACYYHETVRKWISGFKQCLENIKMYPESIVCFKKN